MLTFFIFLAVLFAVISIGVSMLKPKDEIQDAVRTTIMWGSLGTSLRIVSALIAAPTFLGISYIALGPLVAAIFATWIVFMLIGFFFRSKPVSTD